MIEVRIHGRGGQGAVTSAELMALAAIDEGKYAQAFPSFGPERRGAPVVAFLRVSDDQIRVRSKVYQPDVVVVLDPTLLDIVDVSAGLKPKGTVIINSAKSAEQLQKQYGFKGRLATVDATKIAMEEMRVPDYQYDHAGGLDQGHWHDPVALHGKTAEGPLRQDSGAQPKIHAAGL